MELSYYLYGSSARGDSSRLSDVDILVVCTDPKQVKRQTLVVENDSIVAGKKIDFSLYGKKRLRQMYSQGHLFAWHLYRECCFIQGEKNFLNELGTPAPYKDFENDTRPLLELLVSIDDQLRSKSLNVVYEAGLAYVCARNIAMSLSYFGDSGPIFSTNSPFLLNEYDTIFPLSHEEYQLLRESRLAGTRGISPPYVCANRLQSIVSRLYRWAVAMFENRQGQRYETAIC